jgi:hypothetical protein
MFELDQISSKPASPGQPMPTLKRSASEQRLIEASGPDFLEALARGLRVLEAFNQDQSSSR